MEHTGITSQSATIKGTNVVNLRKLFKERPGELEKMFVSQLSPELLHLYNSIVTTTMTPIAIQCKLYEGAAKVLFPESLHSMRLLGKALSRMAYDGVYRIFIRFPTIPFIIKRVPQIWKTFFVKGNMHVDRVEGKRAVLVLREFPDFPESMLEYTIGHILVLLESAGAKNVQVKIDASDANAWTWEVEWQ